MTDSRERPVGEHPIERADVEAEYRLRARERAAELGPINAGDPHPRRALGIDQPK